MIVVAGIDVSKATLEVMLLVSLTCNGIIP